METSTHGAPASRLPDPLLGTILGGKYRILSVMAQGGTGKVYRAKQEPMGRTVAVKVMRPDLDPDELDRFEERFLREASQAGQLQHPNVITVHDFGRMEAGACYIVMEYLDGVPLRRLLRQGPLPPERALHIFEQITRGLRHAHRAGLVHRDMKPGNVMVLKGDDGTDFVKVLDFGLVKSGEDSAITVDGSFLGTPHYVSPEQARGQDADGRADLYSLGVMLYRALTGKLPYYVKGNPMAIAISHVRDPYPEMTVRAPDVRVAPELEDVVRRLMAKDPDERIQDAEALLQELVRVRRGLYPASRTVEHPSLAVSSVTPRPVDLHLLAEGTAPTAGDAAEAPEGSADPDAGLDPAAPRRSGPALVLVGILGLGLTGLLGVGGGLYWWESRERAAEAAALVAAAEAAAAAEAEAVEPEPLAPREVYVLLSSEPSGAEVYDGEELLGSTPFARKVLVPVEETELSRTYTLRLAGHQDGEITVDLSGEEATAHLELARVPRARRAPSGETAGEGSGGRTAGRQTSTATAVTADGVRFSAAEAARAVTFLNEADKMELLGAGMAARQANIVIEKRPWTDVASFAATPYVGQKTLEALKGAVD